MSEQPIRTGKVQYKAGYEQSRFQIGTQPVYQTARVEQYADGTTVYYPPTALTSTSDGGVSLPADLLDKVVWDPVEGR